MVGDATRIPIVQ